MEVFLTGGTGYVGGAVLRALRTRGHAVTALVRREGALDALGDSEVRPLVGDLARPESWADAAAGTVRFATLPGGSRWPFVHVADLAELYALVLEARAEGVFHGATGEPVPVDEVARIVGGLVGATPERLATEEAVPTLGGVGSLMLRDVMPDARRGAELGWTPRHPSFRDAVREAYRAYRAHGAG